MNEDGPVTKSDLNQAVQQLKEYVDERTHDAETRLLRAFGDYQHAETVRFRHMKAEMSFTP